MRASGRSAGGENAESAGRFSLVAEGGRRRSVWVGGWFLGGSDFQLKLRSSY